MASDDTEMQDTAHAANTEATTMTSSINKPATTWHQRGVSWGNNQIFGNNTEDGGTGVGNGDANVNDHSIFRNHLQDDDDNNNNNTTARDRGLSISSDITTDTALHNLLASSGIIVDPLRPTRASLSQTSITVDDVRKQVPREHESDTHLLRAIETRQNKNSRSGDDINETKTTALLGAVPVEAVDRFASSNNNNNNSNNRTRRPSSSSISSGGNHTNHSSEGGVSGGGGTTTSSKRSNFFSVLSSRRGGGGGNGLGNRSASSAVTGNRSMASVSSPKSRRNNNNKSAAMAVSPLTRGKSTRHVRNLTLDQELFNLTAAMDALQNHAGEEAAEEDNAWDEQDEDNDDNDSENDIAINGGGGSLGYTGSNPNDNNIVLETSSGDAFTHNATMLYQRMTASNNNKDKADNASGDGGGSAGGGSGRGAGSSVPFGSASEGSSSMSTHNNNNNTASASPAPTSWRESMRQMFVGEAAAASTSASVGNTKKNDDEMDTLERIDEHEDSEVPFTTKSSESNKNNKVPSGSSVQNNKNNNNGKKMRASTIHSPKVFREFSEFLVPHKNSVRFFLWVMLAYVFLPLVGVATVLFYAVGNPPTGILTLRKDENGGSESTRPLVDEETGLYMNSDGGLVPTDQASASWWLLFILRLSMMGFVSKVIEFVVIDFLSIRSSFSIQVFGPWVTLFIMQSRGWPFLLFWWGILDFALLAGEHPFFSHWLYNQDKIEMFTAANPAGNVIESIWNHRVLAIAVSLGVVVSVKRFWLGLYLGRQTFALYSGRLAKVMRKLVLITETATLAKKLEKYSVPTHRVSKQKHLPAALTVDGKTLAEFFETVTDDGSLGESTQQFSSKAEQRNRIIDPCDRHPLTGSLSGQQKAKITQLLGAWEEPKATEETQDHISVNAILQFRRALACLYTPFPFSKAFGEADTRENCIESAQEVYERLNARSPGDGDLNFEVIALLGVDFDGNLDQQKLKELIRLFRPNRDGTIDILSFAKSIDENYKEIRLLRAAVANSSKIDRAFENIINVIFYGIVVTIILSQLGFDPLALFLSFSGVVLAFAFMISSASSKYFEGLLFILVRRPFQIGDAIHISNVESDTSFSGSAWWVVEDVNLFTTKAVFLYTMERCSLSNGSLANSRIINSSQSSEPYIWFMLKFPVDVSLEKLKAFNSAVEQFVKNRPREWLSYADFRATRVQHDEGYIDYMVGSQHRGTWAHWSTLMLSKADLVLFCNELQKKMGIYYKKPPMPIDMTVGSLRTMQNISKGAGAGVPPPIFEEEEQQNLALSFSMPNVEELESLIPPRGLT